MKIPPPSTCTTTVGTPGLLTSLGTPLRGTPGIARIIPQSTGGTTLGIMEDGMTRGITVPSTTLVGMTRGTIVLTTTMVGTAGMTLGITTRGTMIRGIIAVGMVLTMAGMAVTPGTITDGVMALTGVSVEATGFTDPGSRRPYRTPEVA